LSLPFLEAMMPRAIARAGGSLEQPKSLVFCFVPNGVHMPDWRPQTLGREFEMPWILEPLTDQRKALTVCSGLVHDKARENGDGAGDHARSSGAFLTGVQPNKKKIGLGVSIDQVLATKIGKKSRLSSLVLGVDRGAQSGQCDSGYPCSYSSNMSWTSKTTPALKEVDPRMVFDRMFRDPLQVGGREAKAKRRSVLDLARDEAKKLSRKLSAADRARLDEFETGLRSLEVRLARGRDEDSLAPKGAERPDRKKKRTYEERLELMLELVALSLISDSTRIVSFMFANAGSNRSYRNLDVPEGHHTLSHHGDDAEKHEQIRRINRFHIEHFARLVERLAQSEEAKGSVLDRTCLLYGSGISDGNRHNHDDLPLLLVGGRGAGHVQAPNETPMCDLFRGLASRVGAPLSAFGDARSEYDPLA
ncbi:MAG: DUF1552 domain-containing protein, partial [Planctomycetota bacterium]